MNVLGEPIDERGEISKNSKPYLNLCLTFGLSVMIICSYSCTETEHYLPIHRDAPALVDLATGQEILATGIKVEYWS